MAARLPALRAGRTLPPGFFNTDNIVLISLKLNFKLEKTVNQGALNGVSTVLRWQSAVM
jgi:hypothetical protein